MTSFTVDGENFELPPFDEAKRYSDSTFKAADFETQMLMSHAERERYDTERVVATFSDAYKTIVAHIGSATDPSAKAALALMQADFNEGTTRFVEMFSQWSNEDDADVSPGKSHGSSESSASIVEPSASTSDESSESA